MYVPRYGGRPPITGPISAGPFSGSGPMPRPTGPFRLGGQNPAPMPGGPRLPLLGSFKKGGRVKKTGAYKLHKGEQVVPLSSLARAKK